MRKPGIWGLGFRRQGIIRVADVIDDAGTTTGIVVHVAGKWKVLPLCAHHRAKLPQHFLHTQGGC